MYLKSERTYIYELLVLKIKKKIILKNKKEYRTLVPLYIFPRSLAVG